MQLQRGYSAAKAPGCWEHALASVRSPRHRGDTIYAEKVNMHTYARVHLTILEFVAVYHGVLVRSRRVAEVMHPSDDTMVAAVDSSHMSNVENLRRLTLQSLAGGRDVCGQPIIAAVMLDRTHRKNNPGLALVRFAGARVS